MSGLLGRSSLLQSLPDSMMHPIKDQSDMLDLANTIFIVIGSYLSDAVIIVIGS